MLSIAEHFVHLIGRSNQFEELLMKYNSELMKSLNVNSLLPHLQCEQLLTSAEVDFLISTQKTNYDKKQYLLSILPSKGENAYERFVRCLSQDTEHSGHADLVKKLTRAQQISNMGSYV